MNKTFTYSNSLHLDAVRGNSEARTELYLSVLRGSTGAADKVMRQKLWRSFGLRAKAGQSVGEV